MTISIYYVGSYGPTILFIISVVLLFALDKTKLLLYYIAGFGINIILNILLKGLIKQPRPMNDNQLFNIINNKKHGLHFMDNIPFNAYGMPSGHAQLVLYSLIFIFLSLKTHRYIYFYLILLYALVCFITLYQRVAYDFHTIFQVIVGSLLGLMIGGFIYYIYLKNIAGIVKPKKDDYALV